MDKIYKNAMSVIYEGSEDVHVRNYVAYGKVADHKLYLEAAYTHQVAQADVQDAFKKGALMIQVGDALYAPIAINGNIVMTVSKTGAGAEDFDATDTYAVGDVVTKDGKIYKCTTVISTAAAWDASKWTEIVSLDWTEWAAKAPVVGA